MAIAAQIAETETSHSWLAQVLKSITREEQEMEAEELLSQWITEQTARIVPNQPMAARIVRETAGLLLEHQGIAIFLKMHPQWAPYLPIVTSPQEAARVGAREVMADAEAEAAAQIVLQKMQQGILKPDLLLMASLVK